MHALRLDINSLRPAQPPSRGFIGVAQTSCAKTAAFVLNMLAYVTCMAPTVNKPDAA
jgi:superfamily II DNA/RNA helicase